MTETERRVLNEIIIEIVGQICFIRLKIGMQPNLRWQDRMKQLTAELRDADKPADGEG